MAAAGGTEAVKTNAAAALSNLHDECWAYSLAERFDYTALRPCIPDLMQLLRGRDQGRQEVAALMLWDMSFCDRDSVAELLATPECLAALGAALGSKSKRLLQAAAAVLLNCADSTVFCSAVLAQSQSVLRQLVGMLQPQADRMFQDTDARQLPQTLAANAIHRLLARDRDAAARALAAVPQTRPNLQRCMKSKIAPLKNACEDIDALLDC